MSDDGAQSTPAAADLKEGRAWRAFVVGKDELIDSPAKALSFVRRQLQHDGFTTVIQHGLVEPDYSLEFADVGTINVGDDLRNLGRVQKRCAAHGVDVPYHTPKGWDPVCRCLVRLREVRDEGDLLAEEVMEFLRDYAGGKLGLRDDLFDAVERREPFRGPDGRFYVSVTAFTEYVTQTRRYRIGAPEMRRRLARLGITRDRVPYADGKVSVRKGERVAKGHYAASDPDFDLGVTESTAEADRRAAELLRDEEQEEIEAYARQVGRPTYDP